MLQIHLLFEEVICDCKWYDAKPLQEKLQTLSKDTDFDKIDESDAGELLGSDARSSSTGAGSGGVSPVMTKTETRATSRVICAKRKSSKLYGKTDNGRP